MSATNNGPHGGLAEVELSESVAAYVVYLVWSDAPTWDSRRQLTREEALAFAERLAAHLPAAVRAKLEKFRSSQAA